MGDIVSIGKKVDIKGRTAIITGGANGLGEGTVRRLHKFGANVLIADIDTMGGEVLAAELGLMRYLPKWM
jgi:NAD(P)-dependent dehydrogenase (short-subunit alcohol dehydrogenase family)